MTKLVKTGNSQGVKIPKDLIKLANLSGEIEFELKENGLLLKPANPRSGLEKAFLEAKKSNLDDSELDGWLDVRLVSEEI